MVKTLKVNSEYRPAKTSFNWIKLKKDYLDNSLCNSMNLVVVGADYGAGKRSGLLSTFLLATWNSEKEQFETVCKCSCGFTDE